MPADERTVRVTGHGGTALVCDDLTPRHGATPVVLLHGGAQTRQSWASVPRTLAGAGFRTVAVDLRGHGESQWAADGDYSPEALIGDVQGVIAYIGEPAILVGASLGGLLAMLFSARYPRSALGLILVDVVARNNPKGVDRIRRFMAANPAGFVSFDAAVDAVSTYQAHRPRPVEPAGLWRNLRRGPDGRLVWHWDPQFLLPDGKAWTDGREDLLVQEAARLAVPTALVIGGDSDVVDAGAAEEFRRLVPHVAVSVVDGAAHMLVGDRNDAFGDELLRICGLMRAPAPEVGLDERRPPWFTPPNERD